MFIDNYVHDNNNANVPQVGQAGSTPLGVGLSLSGARNDTVMHNRFVRNNAWAVLIQVQQGEGGPPCIGGKLNFSLLGISLACLFDNWGNAILKNKFADNGSYGHATNGDIGAFNFLSGNPTNCFSGNTDPAGLTTSPAGLEQTHPACTGASAPANTNVPLVLEILCGNEGSLLGGPSRVRAVSPTRPGPTWSCIRSRHTWQRCLIRARACLSIRGALRRSGRQSRQR